MLKASGGLSTYGHSSIIFCQQKISLTSFNYFRHILTVCFVVSAQAEVIRIHQPTHYSDQCNANPAAYYQIESGIQE